MATSNMIFPPSLSHKPLWAAGSGMRFSEMRTASFDYRTRPSIQAKYAIEFRDNFVTCEEYHLVESDLTALGDLLKQTLAKPAAVAAALVVPSKPIKRWQRALKRLMGRRTKVIECPKPEPKPEPEPEPKSKSKPSVSPMEAVWQSQMGQLRHKLQGHVGELEEIHANP